jgi:hypothetical protein
MTDLTTTAIAARRFRARDTWLAGVILETAARFDESEFENASSWPRRCDEDNKVAKVFRARVFPATRRDLERHTLSIAPRLARENFNFASWSANAANEIAPTSIRADVSIEERADLDAQGNAQSMLSAPRVLLDVFPLGDPDAGRIGWHVSIDTMKLTARPTSCKTRSSAAVARRRLP